MSNWETRGICCDNRSTKLFTIKCFYPNIYLRAETLKDYYSIVQ